jgi:hypothetical protein
MNSARDLLLPSYRPSALSGSIFACSLREKALPSPPSPTALSQAPVGGSTGKQLIAMKTDGYLPAILRLDDVPGLGLKFGTEDNVIKFGLATQVRPAGGTRAQD